MIANVGSHDNTNGIRSDWPERVIWHIAMISDLIGEKVTWHIAMVSHLIGHRGSHDT